LPTHRELVVACRNPGGTGGEVTDRQLAAKTLAGMGRAYNLYMLRAAEFTLLVAFLLGGSLEAQRAGGMVQGHFAGLPSGLSSAGQRGSHPGPSRGPGNGFFPGCSHHQRGGYGPALFPYFLPDDAAFWYGQPEPEEMSAGRGMPVVERGDLGQWRMRELPPIKPKLIELPVATANATSAKPAIFILTNGEQVESQRFLLTANHLSVSIDRHERIIPIELLNLEATVAANRERGVDLRIPSDPNEISLSF